MNRYFFHCTHPREWPLDLGLLGLSRRLCRRLTRRIREVLGRWVDDLRPAKPRKRTYLPYAESLEFRWLPTLSITVSAITPTAGVFWSDPSSPTPLGSFSDPNGYQGDSAYTVSIDWGDSSSSAGTLSSGMLLVNIYGAHTYWRAGTYTVTVSATGHGDSGSGNNTATVMKPSPIGYDLAIASQATTDVVIGSQIAFSDLTGGVQAAVPLSGGPASTCGCADPAMAIFYDGDAVGVKKTYEIAYGTDAGLPLPSTVSLRLTFNGTAQATVTYDSTTGHTAGDVLLMDVRSTAAVTATGAYSWSVAITAGLTTNTVSGTSYIAVSSATEGVLAGNGWTFTGVSRLITTTGGVIIKDGHGFGRFFTDGMMGGSYVSPAGDYGSLAKNLDNTWDYTAKGGLYTVHYDTSGYETRKLNADNQATTFGYSGSELTSIVTPDTRRVTLGYDGSGNLQTAQTAAGTVTLTHDGSGNLTGITRLDGSNLTFTYDADSRVTGVQSPTTRGTFVYDGNGMLSSIDGGLSDTYTVQPERSHGFGGTAANLQDGVAVVTDALSHSTTARLTNAGQPWEITRPDGSIERFIYDSNYNETWHTDALGRNTHDVFDVHGDKSSVTTPDGGITTLIYDATLHEVTQVIDPLGHIVTYTYTGSGDLQAQIDATGARTTYTWSGGLAQSVQDANGHLTSYIYDGYNQLIAVVAPTNLRTSFGYDSAGHRTTVQQPDGTVVTTNYDAMGHVTGTIQPDGSRTTMTYDGDGHVTSQTNVLGNLTTFLYDADGRRTTVIDPLGNRGTTVYDAAGNAIAQVDQYGNRGTAIYDAANRPIATEDQYGHYATTVYDAAGQVVAQVNIYGDRTSFTYDANGRQTGTLDAFGNQSTVVYDAAGRQIASVDQFGNRATTIYDAANRVISQEDYLGNYATTVYDSAGNVSATIDQFGNRATNVFDSYGRQVATEDQYGHYATTVFDSYGRVQANVDVLGNRSTIIYDAYGRQSATQDQFGNYVTNVYDSYGRVQATVDALGNRATTIFDSYGRVSANEDPLGHYTTTIYDGNGNVQATIDALNYRVTNVFDGQGRQSATIDQLGNRSTIIYDSYGRVSANEDALGHYVTTIYDSHGRVQATDDRLSHYVTLIYDSSGRQVATEDQLGGYVTTVFDGNGRVSATVDQLGNRFTTIYDSHNNVQATVDALGNRATVVFDSYGRVQANVDPTGARVTQIYDAYGRVSAVQNALGYTTNIYDGYGRQAATEDPLAHYVTTVWDSYGREVATIDQLGNRVTMVLDSMGREVNLIDANSNKTTMVYDDLGRVGQTIDANGGSATTSYDGVGRVSSTTDQLGRRIDYSYDAVGNKIGETWRNADTSVAANLTFTYDAEGRQLTAANPTGTSTLTYDAKGEVTNVQGLWGANITMTYDAAGHRTVLQDSFSGTTTNVYDGNGNLTQQKFGGSGQTPLRIDFVYDGNNSLTGETRYSDLAGTTKVATTSVVYDAAGNETSRIDKDGSGTNIANITNIYDAAGQITSEQLNGGARTSYTYDAAGQLTGDAHFTPTYDAEGNRTNTGYSTGTGNQLSSDGTWNYTYDATGDMTEKANISSGVTWKYGYDNKNELTSAKKWSSDPDVYGTAVRQAEVDYKYDAWGNMTERTDDADGSGAGAAVVTRYVQDGWNPALAGTIGNSRFNVLAELDGSNVLQMRYTRGDKIDQLLARIEGGGTAYWELTDRQGSVRNVIDNTGAVKDAVSYDGFGNITSETNSTYRGRYTWTGREIDVETDLRYNRARWYDSASGRWISRDPLGFDAGDSNLYRYANNRPAIGQDPSGLDWRTKQWALDTLTKTIDEWKNNGWNVAADFLQHFIDKSAGAVYTVPAKLVPEVVNESRGMIERAILVAVKADRSITAGTFRDAIATGQDIPMSFGQEHVRWRSSINEDWLGHLYHQFDKVQAFNNPMFYAFGGAELTIKGAITNVAFVPGALFSWVWPHFEFDVKAQVTLDDEYSFPSGFGRNIKSRYEAANFLEFHTIPGYPKFSTTVTFKDVYSRFYVGVNCADVLGPYKMV